MTLSFLPNEADATFTEQAEPDSVDFEILLLGFQGTGVVSGCEVTESSPVALTIDVAFGEALLDGSVVAVSAQADIVVATPNGSQDRFDLVTVNSSGTVVVTTGTAAANPALPPIPANSVALGALFISASNTQLTLETKTVDSDASSVTFNLPSGVATGDSILLLVSNTNSRTVNTFNAGDTDWTLISHLIEPASIADVWTRVLTSGDSKTTVTANVNGTGNIHCWAYKVEGADVTSAGVATNDLGSTFHQFIVDLDSADSDPKLWVCLSVKNQTGLTEQSFSLDYADQNVHDETQTSPAQSVIITSYASSDQKMFRLNTDGTPHWPYYLKSTNEQMASIAMFFDGTGGTGNVPNNAINDKRVFLRKKDPDSVQVFDLLHSSKITADTLDDEFDSPALDAKWTVVSGVSGVVDPLSRTNQEIYDLTTRPGWLLAQVGSDGSQEFNMYQDVTLADGKSVVLAIAPGWNTGDLNEVIANHLQIGFGLNTSTTVLEPANTYAIIYAAEADADFMDIQSTARNGAAVLQAFNQHKMPTSKGVFFLRIFRDGTDYQMFYSADGSTWQSLMSDYAGAVGAALTKVHISIKNTATTAEEPVPITAIKWIREGGNGIDPWDPYINVGSTGHTILDEGVALPQRERLNFTGEGVAVADVLTGEEDYDDAALTLSPYLHWVMDDVSGNLVDTSGNSRTGTLVGTPTYEVAESGVSASPVSILLNDDEYERGYDASIRNNVSVIMWYKGTDQDAGLFSMGNTSTDKAFDVFIDTSGHVQIRNTPSYVATTGTGVVDDDVWHMICLTVPSSGTNRLYLDGVEVANQTLGPNSGSPAFTLGHVRSRPLIGHVNFCTIYKTTVLTPTQITDLYDARDITGEERWTTVSVRDTRPADETVHVDDDEFDGTDKAGWTELVVSGTATWTEGKGVMSASFEDQSPEDFVVLGKAITTATLPITIETKIKGWLADESGLAHMGIFFSDGLTATDSQVTSVMSFGTSPGLNINNGTFTAHTGVAGGYTFQESGLMHGLGMRMIWTAANTWKALYSIDGVTWVDFEGAESVTMTPTSFGLMVSSWDATSKISLASFEYFRVTDADLSL